MKGDNTCCYSSFCNNHGGKKAQTICKVLYMYQVIGVIREHLCKRAPV